MNKLIHFCLMLAFVCSAAMVGAQESRATLSGLVTDQSSAPVVGAKITVLETRTGTKTSTVSDSAGQYSVPFLAPGDYEVSAEAQGFKQFVRRAIHLESGSHTAIDIKFQVGSNTESVTVTAESPLINASDAAIGQGITQQQVEDFPLNGRNPMMVTQLAIGVIATANPTLVHPFDNGAASGWSMGGSSAQSAEIMMDGSPNATWDNRVAYSPPQDAVQEVKVKAFDTDASYGHGSSTINEVMKTGTNTYHGSLYEFNQPVSLSAAPFFGTKQGTKYNQYGLTMGGPVVVPKLYNGHDKLFWFFSWEVLKDGQPNPKRLTVPTSAERQGDLSALSAAGIQIYNPYSGVLSGTKVTRVPFKCDALGNPVVPILTPGSTFGQQTTGSPCNKIPQQLLNPVALAYLNFYPQPNIAGDNSTEPGYGNFNNSTTTTDDYSNELGRLDWSMSDRSRLSFNIRHNSEFQNKNNYFANNTTGSDLVRNNWGATADEVYILNSSTVLNLRANYTRMNEFHPSPSAGFDSTTLGFPSYINGSSRYLQLPAINFGSSCGNDTTRAASFDCFSATGSDRIPSQSYQFFGDVQKQWGAHAIKFGVDARQYQLDAQSFGAATGSYSFAGVGSTSGWTNGPNATNQTVQFGQDFASFLLGLPTSGTYNIAARGTYTAYYYGLFVQDDWRIKKNLTINLGLRYDHDTPYSEKQGRTVNGFNPTATTTIGQAAVAAYTGPGTSPVLPPVGAFQVPGALTYPSPSDGTIYSNNSHMFSPRIGFAWSPDLFGGKTVFRGGFGIFVQPVTLANLAATGTFSSSPILTQEGFSASTALSVPSNFLSPTATLSNPFPAIQTPTPALSTPGPQTFFGQTIDFLAPKIKNPYSERWSFGFQQELRHDLLLEVVYIGNHSVRLPIAVTQLNGIPRSQLSTLPYRDAVLIGNLNASVPNPFSGQPIPVSGFTGSTIGARQLVVPFPQYPFATDTTNFSSGVLEHNANNGSSNFNSLNVHVQKRMSNGLQLSTTYIWSKLIEQVEYLNNVDPTPERRISAFDHTHRFVTAVNYDLPIGSGKLLNTGAGWMDRIFGGWRVNGIFTYQTGAPLLFMNGSTTSPGDYDFCTVPVNTNGSCPSSVTFIPTSLLLNNRQTVGKAFDVTHFITNTNYQFLYHIRTLPTTFSNLRQDGQNNLDASVIKKIDMTERAYLQFRFEAFNIMNHPTFAAPNMQATSSAFGTITTQANRPRQLQIGLRFVF